MIETLSDSTVLDPGTAAALADSLQALSARITAAENTSAFTTNNVWMLLATFLVFIMSLGFSAVEAGFTQAKNTVNILFKNTVDTAIGIVVFALFGFALMYPGTFNGWLGFAGFGLSTAADYDPITYASGHYTYWTDFLFQAVFCATAGTIVSGAVAERIKISAYFIFTLFLTGLIYPILGSWKWGGGWLNDYGFYDFAGSTIVHSVGGWAALAGVIILGPRLGKYDENGKAKTFSNSSVPLAVIGVFLLWFGWFGFNGGSVLSADPETISLVCVTTALAACTGAIGGFFAGLLSFKRLDLGMVLNGILAGLVGITAGADQMSPNEALLIGLICGLVVVFAVIFFDKLKIDDPVGAISVHLVCGIIGTLAVGVLGKMAGFDQFIKQLVGVGAYGAGAFAGSLLVFFILNKVMKGGIRVSAQHEKEGLDSHEHGMRGYTITYEE
ncbi:MAG TPA: ammonium transporter [Cytophagales bacterium]|nr:ammonium transporter [Cytophagales bacterium]HRG10209.1 ammonium transporter [Cyclobacteriaceae bacterium]